MVKVAIKTGVWLPGDPGDRTVVLVNGAIVDATFSAGKGYRIAAAVLRAFELAGVAVEAEGMPEVEVETQVRIERGEWEEGGELCD